MGKPPTKTRQKSDDESKPGVKIRIVDVNTKNQRHVEMCEEIEREFPALGRAATVKIVGIVLTCIQKNITEAILGTGK
jgi:hypothetical protein